MATQWGTRPEPTARIAIPLRDEIASATELVASLNNAPGGSVRAAIEGESIVIRLNEPTEWAGLPVHYSGRPTFRGSVERDEIGGIRLSGSVDQAAGPLLFNVILAGGAAFGALAGLLIITSGDLTGVILLVVAGGIGVAARIGWTMQHTLSAADEDQLRRALAALSGPPNDDR